MGCDCRGADCSCSKQCSCKLKKAGGEGASFKAVEEGSVNAPSRSQSVQEAPDDTDATEQELSSSLEGQHDHHCQA